MLKDGDEIGNRYIIKERLGGGGFGDVYHARDKKLERDIALKVPKDQEMNLEEFLQEARFLSKFRHPNINLLWDVEEAAGIRFMVLEYADRGSLRKRTGRIMEQQPLSLGETIDIIKQISLGIKAAHNKKIFHRDIKCENILFVGEDYVAQISDFGLSKILDPMKKAMTIAGSWPYMAPEILGKEGGSLYSDIWSLMVMFYELLTGDLPFNSMKEILQKDEIGNPSQINPDLINQPYYEDIDALTLDGLNRDANARPTINHVLQRLEEYERKRKVTEKDKYEEGHIPRLIISDPEIENLLNIKPERQPFTIKVWVDLGTGSQTRDIKVVRKEKGYKMGDHVTIKFTSTKDCYLTLFNLGTSRAITRIFPNELHRENFIQADRVYRIPDDDHEFDYELTGPPGVERLKAFASLESLNLTERYLFNKRDEIFLMIDSQRFLRDIKVTARRLQDLPENSWAEDWCEFRVK
ncbi:MAG: serine/threonine protein kinase [Candidatus Scalindua rubra]|uniref:non-specific serine/threonine protein kinase n=1 Tax=Candidatus Scalindua rubra TaxID=1872076 RepID=A0A1E3X8T1_9BACT|nr:MAG: serine/threonine protein kinase [Candidatus Scalindua rubra]